MAATCAACGDEGRIEGGLRVCADVDCPAYLQVIGMEDEPPIALADLAFASGKINDNTRTRIFNSLSRAGVKDANELRLWRRRDLLAIPNVGGQSVDAIESALTQRGLSLRPDDEEGIRSYAFDIPDWPDAEPPRESWPRIATEAEIEEAQGTSQILIPTDGMLDAIRKWLELSGAELSPPMLFRKDDLPTRIITPKMGGEHG